MNEAQQIIHEILDSNKIAGLGVIHIVAANIAASDIERTLLYLLGAWDGMGAAGNTLQADKIRECREKLKRRFR